LPKTSQQTTVDVVRNSQQIKRDIRVKNQSAPQIKSCGDLIEVC
jgi:hypothetical protein